MNILKDSYLDGFLLPVKTARLEDYRKIAEFAGKIWMEHGALAYHETVLEDPTAKDCVAFPDIAGVKPDETVVFAYILYPSRQARDEINAKVMADARFAEFMTPDMMEIVECNRMGYGGFRSLVSF